MKERRDFTRIAVDVTGNVYDIGKSELSCVIKNVSEGGLLICLPLNDTTARIKRGDSFNVQFFDSFKIRKTSFDFIIDCTALVRRIKHTKDTVELGCSARSQGLSSYIRQKQLAIWYEGKLY